MTNFGFYAQAKAQIEEAKAAAAAQAAMEKATNEFLEKMRDILKITDRAVGPMVSVARNDTVYKAYAEGFHPRR